ncbi:MAG: family 78 glycoside hydrolase catalytic domain [Candidatus Marsarchaeota archaeon]|nr:family 78 glycoside hydrolase catalytic domain [Candidatus Marsarchaeota archaeon]
MRLQENAQRLDGSVLEFDDSGWHDAQVLGSAGCEPWLRLIPRDIPHLATDVVVARKIVCRGVFEFSSAQSEDANLTVAVDMASRERQVIGDTALELPLRLGDARNEFVAVDFGREVTGHVRLKFDGAADGQQIDIGYDEILDQRGLPNPRRTYVHFADRFYLRDGQNQLEVFDGRGFRYLLIDVTAGKGGFRLTGVEIDERTYPVSRVGHFRCSDAALDQLYKISLETTRLCMLDTYVDCPSRERVLWMDSYLEGLCSSYGMGITQLWRKVLYLFAQDTCKTNALTGAVKAYAPSDCDTVMQSYMLYYVCSLCDYVLVSGDLSTGGQLFDVLVDQFSILERFADSNGLLGNNWPSWSSFIDWSAMDADGLFKKL